MKGYFLLSFAAFFLTDFLKVSAINSSANASSTSINQTSTTPLSTSSINPSPTTTTTPASSQNTAQFKADGSSGILAIADIPLPPDDQRRDYDLVANTKMKWIVHLLDKTGPEFVFMANLMEKTFNEKFTSVPGFIKVKLSEFQQDKVTFILTIYTRKSAEVSKEQLEAAVGKYLDEGNDLFKIYQYEVKPRFRDMPPDNNVAPVYGGPATPPEEVSLFMAFIRGFGIAIGMVVVFTMIAVTKYKITQACKSKRQSDTQPLQKGFDNEGMD